MKKIYTVLLVIGLLITLAGGISAEEEDGNEVPGNLVRPTTTEGDVFILGNPNEQIYPEDNQKGLEEPLIMPAPEVCEDVAIAPYSHDFISFDMQAQSLFHLIQMYLLKLLQAIFSLPVA